MSKNLQIWAVSWYDTAMPSFPESGTEIITAEDSYIAESAVRNLRMGAVVHPAKWLGNAGEAE